MRDTAGGWDELISDVLLWTSLQQRLDDQLEPTYTCEDTGYSSEDLPEAMDDREGWRERIRDIRANGAT